MLTRFLLISDVCNLVGMSSATIYEMSENGSFPTPFRFGKKRKWREDDIKEWMNSLTDAKGKKIGDPTRKTWTHTPAALAHLSSLAGLAMEFPSCEMAVYFLLRGGQVMYVGQSCNLPHRIGHHRNTAKNDPNRTFDRVFYIPLEGGFLSAIEKEYISLFAPPWNIAGNVLSEVDD